MLLSHLLVGVLVGLGLAALGALSGHGLGGALLLYLVGGPAGFAVSLAGAAWRGGQAPRAAPSAAEGSAADHPRQRA